MISTATIIASLLGTPALVMPRTVNPVFALAPHPEMAPLGRPRKIRLKSGKYWVWDGEKTTLESGNAAIALILILALSLGLWIGVIIYCIKVGSPNALINLIIFSIVMAGILYTWANWGKK
jgi:hypothetical protein